MGASNATAAQGTTLYIGSLMTSRTITAITKDSLGAVATIASHGFTDGQIGKIASVGGMVEINGLFGAVQVIDANTVRFPNIDSSGFATYTSGGTISAPAGGYKVGNITGFSGFDGKVDEIDATDMDSTAKEFMPGLYDGGSVTFDVQINDGSDGQNAARANLNAVGLNSAFKLTYRNGKGRSWSGYISSFSESGSGGDLIKGQLAVRISSRPTRF